MLVPVSIKELAATAVNVLTDPTTTGSWWSNELFLSLYALVRFSLVSTCYF